MAKSPRRIGAVELARETNLGRHLLVFNDSEVVELLRAAVEREGNQSAFARRHGVERTRLNQILNGKNARLELLLRPSGLGRGG
jgi:hypothetical protein